MKKAYTTYREGSNYMIKSAYKCKVPHTLQKSFIRNSSLYGTQQSFLPNLNNFGKPLLQQFQ